MPYLEDEEEIKVDELDVHPITMAQYVRKLIEQQEYHTTHFPRLPYKMKLDIDNKLKQYDAENPGSLSLQSARPANYKSNHRAPFSKWRQAS